MLQRIVYASMAAGLSAFQSTPSLFDELFSDVWLLSSTEVANIKAAWAANPPSVSHAFKHNAARFPQYVIVTSSEQQPLFALGDYGGPGAVGATPAGGFGVLNSSYSSLWTHNVQIVSQAAKQVEMAFYMHEVAKAIMVSAKKFLQSVHVDLPTMSGSELSQAPAAADSGDFVFQRVLTFRAQREFKIIDAASALSRVFSVTGIERPTALAAADELQLVSTIEGLNGQGQTD